MDSEKRSDLHGFVGAFGAGLGPCKGGCCEHQAVAGAAAWVSVGANETSSLPWGRQTSCRTFAGQLWVWQSVCCTWHKVIAWTVWDPYWKFMAPLQCLDVPEISLSPLSTFSIRVLILSSTAGNVEEKSEERDLRQMLFCVPLKCKWLLMCQDVQAGGKE